MPLKVDLVAALPGTFPPDKVVQRYFIERCGGSVCRNMSPGIAIGTVRTYHHGHGIPAYQAFNTSFDVATARKEGLFVDRNGIDIRCIGRKRQLHTGFLSVDLEVLQQAFDLFRSPMLQYIVERIEPFLRFYSIQLSNDIVLIYPITHLGAFPSCRAILLLAADRVSREFS